MLTADQQWADYDYLLRRVHSLRASMGAHEAMYHRVNKLLAESLADAEKALESRRQYLMETLRCPPPK